MALVNVSLDTASRQVVLTINGVMVPIDECYISKERFDNEDYVRFAYTVESINNGMKEKRQFYLPSPEELATQAHAALNEDGLASKSVINNDKAQADTIEFLKQRRS